jgi:tetratricopeptide (TPR) repeat protein
VTGTHNLIERAKGLEEEGYEAFKAGDVGRSRELNEQSLVLAREAGDAETTVWALAGLMRLGLRARDFDEVERLAIEGEDVASSSGNTALRRMPLHMRAEAARMQGDLDRARELYDESIALNQELRNQAMVTVELGNKAWVEIATGRLDEAERLLRASLSGTDDDYGVAFCLLGLARVKLERRDEHGAEILGAAEAIFDRAKLVWDPAEEPEYTATVQLARTLLGGNLDERRAAGEAVDPRAF